MRPAIVKGCTPLALVLRISFHHDAATALWKTVLHPLVTQLISLKFVDSYRLLADWLEKMFVPKVPTRRWQQYSAAKNFVREGPVSYSISHWRRLESDCFFRLFSNSWKWSKAPVKIFSIFFRGEGTWPPRPHSGCATGWQLQGGGNITNMRCRWTQDGSRQKNSYGRHGVKPLVHKSTLLTVLTKLLLPALGYTLFITGILFVTVLLQRVYVCQYHGLRDAVKSIYSGVSLLPILVE